VKLRSPCLTCRAGQSGYGTCRYPSGSRVSRGIGPLRFDFTDAQRALVPNLGEAFFAMKPLFHPPIESVTRGRPQLHHRVALQALRVRPSFLGSSRPSPGSRWRATHGNCKECKIASLKITKHVLAAIQITIAKQTKANPTSSRAFLVMREGIAVTTCYYTIAAPQFHGL
jgi:hypothetical protein